MDQNERDKQQQRLNRHRDEESDIRSRPAIPTPGEQPDQQQLPNAPPQPATRRGPSSSQLILPRTGNPDLDPALGQRTDIDLRQPNPLTPQGMLFDPRQLHNLHPEQNRQDLACPPGARFDPFGPPDPSLVGPGRGPLPSSQYGVPDPDHLPPPGTQQDPFIARGKSIKGPWPPGPGRSGGFPPPGGAGGSPFL